MYKKIIVPLDGSLLAEAAIPYAEEIAIKTGSDIIFLTVLPEGNPEEYLNYNNYINTILDSSRQRVQKICQAQGTKAVDVDTATRIGSPVEGILDYLKMAYSYLVVMVTHGRSGLGGWALGSVADKVVRSTLRQPLILIRAGKNMTDVRTEGILKRVLVPLDGSARSEAVIDSMTLAAVRLKMMLTLFRVIPKADTVNGSEDYLRDWCRRLHDEGVEADYEIRTGSPAERIVDYANEKVFDMVAMSTRGQTGVSRWTLGSVAQKVLLASATPLLLVKA